jgi:hypothetical protein
MLVHYPHEPHHDDPKVFPLFSSGILDTFAFVLRLVLQLFHSHRLIRNEDDRHSSNNNNKQNGTDTDSGSGKRNRSGSNDHGYTR